MTSPFVSYAQNHEDVVLARALNPDQRPGFWIDVGAGHPLVDSVTAAFAERGWRGVNVEPLPAEYESLCRARPRDTTIQVALGSVPGVAKFWEGPDENRGSSTLVPELVERYRSMGQEFREIQVDVRTLDEIVGEHAPATVDFLKIDVEGFEYEVLSGADWSRFHPRVIVAEATVPNSSEPSYESWEPLLLDGGYVFVMFDGLNRFYASADEPELIELMRVPANVLDNFVPYRWLRALEDAGRAARYAQDLAAAAQESAEVFRADLARSEVKLSGVLEENRALRLRGDVSAEMLANVGRETRILQAEVGVAMERARAAHDELDRMRRTRSFRYTRSLRRLYRSVRRKVPRRG